MRAALLLIPLFIIVLAMPSFAITEWSGDLFVNITNEDITDVYIERSGVACPACYGVMSFIKIPLSEVPAVGSILGGTNVTNATVNNVTFCGYMFTEEGVPDDDVSVRLVARENWSDTLTGSQNFTNMFNSGLNETNYTAKWAATGWDCIEITDLYNEDVAASNTNFTFVLFDTDVANAVGGGGTVKNTVNLSFGYIDTNTRFQKYLASSSSSENASYIYINYTLKVNYTSAGITDCNENSNLTSLQFNITDEENRDPVNSSFDITFLRRNDGENFSFTDDGEDMYRFCIFPPNETSSFDVTTQYGNGTTHPIRMYFMRNELLTNITQEISLLSLNNTFASPIQVTVQDSTGVGVSGLIVTFDRQYIGLGTEETVAMIETSVGGEGVTYLRKIIPRHNIIIERDGVVLKTLENYQIVDDSFILKLDPILIVLIDYLGKQTGNCSFVNTTKTLTCNLNDSSQTVDLWTLTTSRNNSVVGMTETCRNTTTGFTDVVLQCYVGEGDYTHVYNVLIEVEDTDTIIDSGVIVIGVILNPYGAIGLLAGIFVLLLCMSLFLFSPEAGIIGLGLGLIVNFVLKLWVVNITSLGFSLLILGAAFYLMLKGR